MPSNPTALKRQHAITQHGITRNDEYYWMREREDPEVLKFLYRENDHLKEVLKHTSSLQEQLFQEMKNRIKEVDSTVPEKSGDYFYYSRMEANKQYPIFCRKLLYLIFEIINFIGRKINHIAGKEYSIRMLLINNFNHLFHRARGQKTSKMHIADLDNFISIEFFGQIFNF